MWSVEKTSGYFIAIQMVETIIIAFIGIMRYTLFFTSFLLPFPSYLLPAPCSLLPKSW